MKKVLVLILLSLVSFAACQQSETCTQRVLDVFLVIDSSGSIGPTVFPLAKDAVLEMINQLNAIGPQKIRVGVINYSTDVEMVTSLVDTDQDKEKIIVQVKNMPYLDQMTATGDALQKARKTFFDYPREVIPRVVVLFTDGQSNTGANVITEADLLKKLDVSIFTVGIGPGINHDELDAVSSLPLSTYKKFITNYQDLYAAINNITHTACETHAFIKPGQKILAQAVEKNEQRNYQVDMTKLSKAAGDLIQIQLKTITGMCLVDAVSWLTNSKTQPIVSSNVSNDVPQEGKAVLDFYEIVPPNALRLYVNVKCINIANSYEFVIDKIL